MKIQINTKAPIVCKKKILIDANTSTVWNILTDINKWPQWQNEISSSQLNGDLLPDNTFVWKSAGMKIQSKLHTVEQNSKFGWSGKTMGIYAIHNWEISEKEGKSVVEVEESMEGLLAKIFKKSMNKTLKNGMQKWYAKMVRQFKNRVRKKIRIIRHSRIIKSSYINILFLFYTRKKICFK